MKKITVRELIAELEQYDDETEVRLAQQPHWPFEYSVGGIEEVWVGEECVVYIAEGSQLAYLPSEAREAFGWRRS